jgi:CheY-like chemotaxis protein/phosphoribosyl 1,2-cyclic phosphodiesterase
MRIRFWGTRGSLAKPGPKTLRYGGNTSCVEVRTRDGTLIVLDCGTGAHELGLALAASGEKPLRGHLVLTHTHWDHIQGFPFFAPLFVAGNEWDIYAPGGFGQHLETTLAGQMEYNYFPVTLAQLGATIRYHELAEGTVTIGGAQVTAQYLNHPALTLGYRIEVDGATFVYAVDHEPNAPSLGANPSAPSAAQPVHAEDRRHVDFLSRADLVVHDTQYTAEEYPQKEGWGHCPAETAVDYAIAAGAKRLALFHYDPQRSDDAVDRVLALCKDRVARSRSTLDVFASSEGMTIELGAAEAPKRSAAKKATSQTTAAAQQTVLVADDDSTIVKLLVGTLEKDGFRVITTRDGESAIRLARETRPALVLLDWEMPGATGVEVTKVLRADADAALRDVPIVLITSQGGADNTATGFAAGVTDYLTKPFRPAHLRTRVRTWLLRGGAAGTESS